MSTFTKIKALKGSLSSSELKLAKFALDSSNVIRELSSQELANVVGVSQSSVVKFAQKLGYKGYPAFKLGIIDALNHATTNNNLHGKITINDSFSQMSDKLLSSKISVLSETQKLNDEKAFLAAVELLKSAKRILICGLGGSALVGKDFSYKLQKLGMLAIEEPDTHAQLAFAATLTSNDLVFAISESGTTKEIVNVVTQAKRNNCKIISITRYGSNPISDMADVKLYSIADEESARLSSILARTAQEFIIDILFIAITQSSRQGRQILEKTNTVVGEFRRLS
ncbi:MurR/RpiR family transcriptional regulator [Paraglaciecola hydrolytica]|uniref:RpiR family transcriptional regulator n=1 Tax=Paraglaciecola hydrolytica TaxID=1799789 RepID=A0A136A4B9_9ALTE|nr:MurR/RpiR family transcriptional regulator [Paraglaciecola hydrolytica]KXI30059.1 RpiR family transcriptional regulator [Paraglaciecola hydrolytica]